MRRQLLNRSASTQVMTGVVVLLWSFQAAAQEPPSSSTPTSTAAGNGPNPVTESRDGKAKKEPEPTKEPWEYRPYRTKVWIVSDAPQRLQRWRFQERLHERIDREVHAAWSISYEEPPARYEGLLYRDFESLDYASLAGGDVIMVVNAANTIGRPLRDPKLVGTSENVKEIPTTPEIAAQLRASSHELISAFTEKLVPFSSSKELLDQWGKQGIYAVVIPRALLPSIVARNQRVAPRVIELPLEHQMKEISTGVDKLLMVRVKCSGEILEVSAKELDGQLQLTGPAVTKTARSIDGLCDAASAAVLEAFSPVVRIENAGRKDAKGRVRAAGLFWRPESPAMVQLKDVLQPWVIKYDRAGKTESIGLLDWTYGIVSKLDEAKLDMDVYSGRSSALQTKQTRRTERVAIRVRLTDQPTTLRLHARARPDSPMTGYEVYEKNLVTNEMVLVGRTNWDGRLNLARVENPLRLLYIKNGGSVLARLPVVPGLFPIETADLVGDDARLRAEAYLKGIENGIIDLVAQRQLYGARIRTRLKKNKAKDAQELLEELKLLPGYSEIAADMAKQAPILESKNSLEQKKINTMFAKTRELLIAQITEKFVKDIEMEVSDAIKGITREKPEDKKDI